MPGQNEVVRKLPPQVTGEAKPPQEPIEGPILTDLKRHLGTSRWVREDYPKRFLKQDDRDKAPPPLDPHVVFTKDHNEAKNALAIARAKQELSETEEANIADLSETAQSYLLLNELFGNTWQKKSSKYLITLPLSDLLSAVSAVDDRGFGRSEWVGSPHKVVERHEQTKREQKYAVDERKKSKDTKPDPLGRLVEDVKNGEENAFEKLYKRTYRDLHRIAIAITENEKDAEDVLQETYTRIATSIHSFRETSKASLWLNRIVVNCAKTYNDKRRRRKYTQLPDDHPVADIKIGANPELAAESRFLSNHVNNAIDALTPRLRQAIILRDLQGRSAKEVQEITGLNNSAVKTNTSRARAKLREHLSPTLTSEEQT